MIWDEQHLKALLNLRRYPRQLLDEQPWVGWLAERNGISDVRTSLRQAVLEQHERELLELILSDPSVPPARRAAMLHISQSTYFRYLDDLVASLLAHLNGPEEAALPATRAAGNIPVPLTAFIGAESALQNILSTLMQPQVRLLTLMGPGGIGKTRLSIQAARSILENDEYRQAFGDGVFWVDLAPLRAPDLILVEIARVLGLTERSGYPTLELLQHALRERRLLLLLDNFEHVLAAAPLVAALLQGTRQLKILVTSRAALNISGEHRLSISPLGLPGSGPLPAFEHLNEYSAIQLFVQRARAIDETFALTPDNAPAVAQLCAALDGLPLALEIAAKRLSHLSPQQMLTMIGQRLQLLTGGSRDVAPRHQSFRSLIDWSYQLLDIHEQMVFQRLAVFANGWTLEAMEAVCKKSEGGSEKYEIRRMKDEEPNTQPFDTTTPVRASPSTFNLQPSTFNLLDILAVLIDQSIIFQQPGKATPRFGMLETIREYAHEKLVASGEEALVRQCHAAYYLSLVKAWSHAYIQPSTPKTPLENEYHNLRIALQWAIEQNQPELALDLSLALWHYWTTNGSPNEGQYWLVRVLLMKPSLHSIKRIQALILMGQVTLYQNNFQQAYAYYDEMAALSQELNQRNDLGIAWQGLGDIAHFTGNYPRARELYLASLSLCRETQNIEGVGWTLDRLGNTSLDQGLIAEALAFYSESLTVFEGVSLPGGIAHARAKLGLIAFEEERYEDAAQLFESSLTYLRPRNPDWYYAWLLEYLGQAVLGLGDLPRAADFFRQSLKIHFEGRAHTLSAYCLHGLANVALAEGQTERAVRLLSAVEMIYEQYPPIPARRRRFEQSLTRSRDALDPAAFDVAWREGQQTPLEQIVAHELDIQG